MDASLIQRLQVLFLLALTIGVSLSAIIRLDLLAGILMVLIGLFQLLPPEQLFQGFASEAALSLMASMIMSAGMERSGIANVVSSLILRSGVRKPILISFFLMITSALLSSFMRSIAAVALLLPVINTLSARLNISRKCFLLPVAFCAIIGGTLTMVGSSPLLLLNSLIVDKEMAYPLQAFNLFDVTPIGLLLLATGSIYLMFVSHRWQKIESEELPNDAHLNRAQEHYAKTYGVACDLFELKISKMSSTIGMSLPEFEAKLDGKTTVVAILKGKNLSFPPLRKTTLEAGMSFAVLSQKNSVDDWAPKLQLQVAPRLKVFAEILNTEQAGLGEVVIPPRSHLVGAIIGDLHMKRNYNLQVLSLRRDDKILRGGDLAQEVLKSGDALGLFTQWSALSDFDKNPDFAVITSIYPKTKLRLDKMPYAAFFFITAIGLVLLGHYSLVVGLLYGAMGMVLTGVLTMEEAYEAISWHTLFLVAGLMPLGLIIQSTGTAQWLTSFLALDQLSHTTLLIGFAVTSSLLTLFISNIGATIVLVPLALDLSHRMGTDPKIYALTVAIAASNAFLIPTHQANALITGSGYYSARDFFRIGGVLTILYWAVSYVALRLFFDS